MSISYNTIKRQESMFWLIRKYYAIIGHWIFKENKWNIILSDFDSSYQSRMVKLWFMIMKWLSKWVDIRTNFE